jgi:hypothetical protein
MLIVRYSRTQIISTDLHVILQANDEVKGKVVPVLN